MKKIFLNIVCVISMVWLGACEGDLESEGISRITYYPVFDMKGDQWNTVAVGEPFTDAGVTAMEGASTTEVTITGDVVNVNKPGVYTIIYTATNKDGFSATTYRYVGVVTPANAAQDLSGTYRRDAGQNGISTVTRLAPGFYYANNVGGTTATGTGVYFYHFEGNTLGVPPQLVGGSLFYCANATVNVGVSYSWVVINSGYGTALRNFIKQ